MATLQDVQTWRGHKAIDREGSKIGTIEDIYLDRATGEPEWAAVKTGLFGSNVSFVPIEGATPGDGELRLGYTKDEVKHAPHVEADGALSAEEEQRLYEHYGRSDYGDWSGEDRTAELGLAEERDDRFSRDEAHERPVGRVPGEPTGRDTSGPTTDDAMTRSEEELRVGTERREAGRARLRKYVTTENVQKTVPVRREEVRVEREPITEANRDAAMDGPAISEEEHEVVLHEEQPVVETRAVPKERVRLDTETRTDEETVGGEVRKEHIEAEGDTEGRGKR